MKDGRDKNQVQKKCTKAIVKNVSEKEQTLHHKRKKKRRYRVYIAILITLVFLFILLISMGQYFKSSGNETTKSSAENPNVKLDNLKSQNAILMSIRSDSNKGIVTENNADEKIFPASLTKIMTAITAIENLNDLEQEIELPYEFFQYLYEMDASVAGFEAGELVTAEDLLYGVILASGAECCLTLADYIAGSEDAYVKLMNQKAKDLGMENTHFCNATGLQDENHYTTVKDIAVLLKYALDNQEFRKIFTARSRCVEPTNIHPEGFTVYSTLFENMESAKVTGGEILGGKTGYTNEAGLCLASLAFVNGEEYILVTACAKGSHETQQYHIDDAVKVYNQISQRSP